MPTMKLSPSDVDELVRKGATVGPSTAELMARAERESVGAVKERKPKPLVTPLTVNRPDGTLVYVIPLETVGEANQRQWQARNRRAGAAWKAVRAVVRLDDLAPYAERLQAGGSVAIRFVRLGGRELDPMVNLPSAMKGVEDAFAYLLGVDDRSPLWRPSCGQEAGERVGVRVEIE